MPVIHYRGPGGQTVERRFADRLTIGRDPANDIVLSQEPAASRNHARIGREGDGYVLTDPGSRNGTTVERAGQTFTVDGAYGLEDGDVVRIGVVELRFATEANDDPGATRMFDAHATQVDGETEVGAIVVPPIAPAPPRGAATGTGSSRLTAGIIALTAAAVTVGAAVGLVVFL